ncbi:MAG TPA: lysylphosphatidylglycerol synthase transmembrane domain-containing protein [Candidatus Cloacimonadota bacterium]|nr:lysylphosphatidylglycerol synthase transmembrane domain-containing protein [Candidatus Cloacimonadota bacterium]
MNRKQLISLGFGLILGILLILLWSRLVETEELLFRFRSVLIRPVLIALACYMLAYFIRSLRWYLLIGKSARVGMFRVWSYSLTGNFVNYLIPIRLGEITKAWLLKERNQLPMPRSLSTIFIDKSFDTVGIFLALVLLPFLRVRFTGGMVILLGVLALIFAVSLVLLLLAVKRKHNVIAVLQALFKWLPFRLRSKLNGYIELFVQGLNIFDHHWSRLLVALGLTILGVLLDGLYFWLIFSAFGLSYSFAMVLFGYTLINLSYALPQPPAQLGSNEWMMIIIFSAGFGLTKADASAVMAFAHLLTAAVILISGVLSLSLNGSQIMRKIFKGEDLYE